MDMLRPQKSDVVYDIGCGDARFLVTAAVSTGCTCIGIEYDADLVRRAHLSVEQHHVVDLVSIRHEDATDADFTDATLIFLYLVPKGIQALLPRLIEARARGVKICTNIFSIPSWTPTRTGEFKGTKRPGRAGAAFNAQNRNVEEASFRRVANHHQQAKYTAPEGFPDVPRQYVKPSHSTERDFATYAANSYTSAIAITELLGKREI
ncbi:hypothetical protein DYB26_006636 [Aphanomyces astaci]|uniref:Methyltransferase domain-containing protein n=1 Tax=Aphanomyces astaci TaxID=112090 RepID=A0A397CR30_APHAT|nr:hypothetical protein DYB38_006031 [Aphanomyces astaci]RHY75995.1 hypothetical protein DYB34_008391 [Aphanomyces astaci]RHZ31940.1 hypothetical protein DYB26_006636 [Aphanomyces astaci]